MINIAVNEFFVDDACCINASASISFGNCFGTVLFKGLTIFNGRPDSFETKRFGFLKFNLILSLYDPREMRNGSVKSIFTTNLFSVHSLISRV